MFIKMVIIEGFKTYKDRTVIGPFNKKFNLVLGKNGSGKSNLLDAIQFVLSDKFASLRTQERRSLLHEGTGRQVISASVEIVFDNSDRRFAVDQDEVSLKRQIGSKKDEYFLNNRHCRKSEIVDLLESAGMSRYNPYNIVQQGKVSALTNMTDAARLELLREIAGTRTYDDRRKESMKIMKDTDARRERIEEVISYMETRLAELQEEKDELNEYQKLDTQRRCLEYTIYDKELQHAVEQLKHLEENRGTSSQSSVELHEAYAAAKKAREAAEEELKTVSLEAKELAGALERLESERRDAVARRASLEISMKDLKERYKGGKQAGARAAEELKGVEKKIEQTTAALQAATDAYNSKLEEEHKLEEDIALQEQRQQELYAKQGRKQQFSSKAERDEFLRGEIEQINEDLKELRKQAKQHKKTAKTCAKDVAKHEKEVASLTQRADQIRTEVKELSAALDQCKEERDAATDARKEFWRESEELEKEVNVLKTTLTKAERNLTYTMDKHLARGLSSVKQIAEEQKLKGVYGPIIELFSCDRRFQKCVETTGGNSLFHVVVETDELAAKLIKELNKRRGGRVTFIPLNQINPKNVEYPRSQEAIPMIGKLKFKSHLQKAMQQVFGKTVIVRNLSRGGSIARQYKLNAITLDGDQVNKKGALTGGFIDYKYSRLALQKEIATCTERLEEVSARYDKIKQSADIEDQKVTQTLGQIQRNNAKRHHLRNELIQCQEELRLAERNRDIAVKAGTQNDESMRSIGANIRSMEERVQSLEEEMDSDMVDDLNTQDQDMLHSLSADLADSKKRLATLVKERTTAEIEKQQLETVLSSNLFKQRAELQQVVSSASSEEDAEQLDAQEHKLKLATDEVDDLNSRISEFEKKVDADRNRKHKLQADLENLKSVEARHERDLVDESKKIEKVANKRSILSQKKADCTRKIMELGGVPSGVEKFKNKQVDNLMRLLEKCNQRLKKYSHVNKKAIDQYMNFTEQRDDLLKRKKELDDGRKSILGLIEHLDKKKDEAIRRSFKLISQAFSKTFASLVRGGKAKLLIHTKIPNDDEDEVEEKKANEDVAAAYYTGVGIEVSFGGGQQSLSTLSGGQQTVVALSLIFAIQRCDPSPFYIFDEIDSALDAIYRTSVAKAIATQAKEAQFIATTQNKEMLQTAHQFWSVAFKNKVSKVGSINKRQAEQLMQSIEEEEEKKK